MKKKLTYIVFIFYLILLTWLVLFKLATNTDVISHIRNINLIPFGESVIVNGKIYLKEIIYNIIFFIPLGIYLSIVKKDLSLIKKCLIGLSVSLLFEILQYIFYLGGSDITDIINNTLGVILGIGLYSLLKKLFKEKAVTIINIIGLVFGIIAISLLVLLTMLN